jgi:predicted Zn-dependent protease
MTAMTALKNNSLSFRSSLALIVPVTALLLVAGCTNMTLQKDLNGTKVIDSMSGDYKDTDARLNAAANDALAAGRTNEALEIYKKLSGRHPHDRDIAIGYAQMLRKTGDAEKAAGLLAPYAQPPQGKDGKPVANPPPLDPQLANELAADYIALGRFDAARSLLTPMIGASADNPWRVESTNLMGVVEDAQGNHKEAEKMFRAALDGWKGDATSVQNNLALCLASQGKFDESLTTLRKALLASPDNKAVARNIQIVTDLRKNVVPAAPVSLKK